ncbi:GNAT family N-acetyltransferase [Cohnella sp. 56]|uniref:GNAT family N-acetyltransferase n=1 Tax=Cohnella sp. 56 TaxID=3113722 RepID=UPI0030EA3171
MHIRVLEEADADAYRRIRLNALQHDPDAYGSTYERESQFPPETFAARVKPDAGKFVLGVFADESGDGSVGKSGDDGEDQGMFEGWPGDNDKNTGEDEGNDGNAKGRVLVGIASFVRESGMKSAHKGSVYGVYVSPESRGKGAGKTLMLALIRRARGLDGLEQINLTVVSDNVTAKRLYESLGFEVYGIERRAIKYGGRYFDEELMVLRL